jgi:hypothetical protein
MLNILFCLKWIFSFIFNAILKKQLFSQFVIKRFFLNELIVWFNCEILTQKFEIIMSNEEKRKSFAYMTSMNVIWYPSQVWKSSYESLTWDTSNIYHIIWGFPT